MGLFSRSSKRNSKVIKTAPSDDAAPGAQPLEASQSQQPETPGPNVPGGPGPDSRFKNAPNDSEAMHTSPTAASSLPPSLSPANGSAFASNGNAQPLSDIAQPQPEPVTQTPRFSQHVQEGTAASEATSAGDIGNTPSPTANPPLVTQSGNVVDAPPQHPAVTGAGTGIGAPIDRQSQSSPRASHTSPAAAALPALNGARGSPPGSGIHSPAQRAASPASLNIPNRGRAQNDDRIVYPGDPVTPPADREGVQLSDPGAGPKPILRNSSVRSRRSQRGNGDNAGHGRASSIASRGRAASIRTSNTTGSTFGNGAVTVQPYVDPDVEDSVAERRAVAEQSLTKKDSARIAKAESRHNRKLSKVIKSEAISEGKAMDVVLRELSDLQRLQKSAIRDEGVAHSAHTKALAAEHKAELALLAARRAHETALAESRAASEALESSRAHARETTEMLREKAEEVETLRVTKGADDRERAVRVRELNGGSSGGGLGRLFGR